MVARRARSGCLVALRALVSVALVGAITAALPSPAGASSAPIVTDAGTTPGAFHAVASTRIEDTRTARNGALKSNGTLTLKVVGRVGIPAAGASAAFVHVTVANVTKEGYLTVYPDGAKRPATSSLNYAAGKVASNSIIVALPADGAIVIFASAGPVAVIVDVSGWYGTGSEPGGYLPVTQTRLVDTRPGHGPQGGHQVGNTPITVKIAGTSGVAASAAAAVLNVTVVDALQSEPVVLWPAGAARPATSNVNSARGRAVAGLAIVALGASGAISAAVIGGTSADLVIDLLGYIAGGTAATNGLTPVTQTRLLDTRRTGAGPLRSGVVNAIQVGGVASVPQLANAALVTVTLVQLPKPSGYVTVWQAGAPRPTTSIANPTADAPIAQTAIVALDVNGRFNISYQGSGDVVIDLLGYLVAAPLPEVVAPTVSTAALTSAAGVQAAQILQTANRYALKTWWNSTAPALLAHPMDSSQQNDPDDSVRRLAMEAFSLAVSISTGAYSANGTGVSEADAIAITVRIVEAVAAAHAANRVGGWGASWQSDMWASYAGRAGWLLWDVLSAVQRIEVERMVESEADFVLTLSPKYMVNSAGTVLTAGDTGAEEDAWYSLAPALGIAMMPNAPQHSLWLAQQEQMQIAGWARPGDLTSTVSVDGRPLSSWLKGSNVMPNGVVMNHNRIAPDYSTNAYQDVDTVVMAALAGKPAPQSSTFGLAPVYSALSSQIYTVTSTFATPDGQPSGAIYYSPTNPTIYYPQGCDWGVGQEIPYALFDADAAAFGFGLPVTAQAAEAEHAGAAAAMQLRPQTGGQPSLGAMYRDATPPEYTYAGREEHAAQLAAQLYLAEGAFEGNLAFSIISMPVSTSQPSLVQGHAPLPAQNEGIYRQ